MVSETEITKLSPNCGASLDFPFVVVRIHAAKNMYESITLSM